MDSKDSEHAQAVITASAACRKGGVDINIRKPMVKGKSAPEGRPARECSVPQRRFVIIVDLAVSRPV
jgi:hypothetical protein